MGSLFNYADPNSLVSRLRLRRSQLLQERIAGVTAEKGDCRVLDVGGVASYWLAIFGTDWLRANRVHVTLLNHTDEYVGTPDPELFAVVIADGCALPYGGCVHEFWPTCADGFWPTPGPSTYGRPSISGGQVWTGEPKWICSSSYVGSMNLVSAR
jgi:hypothetical protein